MHATPVTFIGCCFTKLGRIQLVHTVMKANNKASAHYSVYKQQYDYQ
jgi:hypothetical protein